MFPFNIFFILLVDDPFADLLLPAIVFGSSKLLLDVA
jgi:hypothetical protein